MRLWRAKRRQTAGTQIALNTYTRHKRQQNHSDSVDAVQITTDNKTNQFERGVTGVQPPVFTSYQNWLNEQKMPNGKRAALLSALALFSKQGYDGTSTMAIAEHAGLVRRRFLSILKRSRTC